MSKTTKHSIEITYLPANQEIEESQSPLIWLQEISRIQLTVALSNFVASKSKKIRSKSMKKTIRTKMKQKSYLLVLDNQTESDPSN